MNKPNPNDHEPREGPDGQEQGEQTTHWTRETRVASEYELAQWARPVTFESEPQRDSEPTASPPTFGGYRLLSEIARGGMGVVFKAYQAQLNRVVAVKMILGGRLASDEQVQRFLLEAEAAANLSHPGIVPIYEFGEHEGTHYFSMAFIDGPSLAGQAADTPLKFEEAAILLKKVGIAIAYAHEQGVIHRDLKPANILLDRDGEPRVTDFGLAKRTGEDSELTETGAIMGSIFYMSPEQASGNSENIGPPSDIYALGAILYKLLTGHPPFQSATALETIQQVVSHDPVAPRRLNPRIPRDLETICLKCLEKEAHRRYGSASELTDELDRFLEGEPIRARSISRGARTWRWCRRNPLPASLAIGLAVAIFAGVITATTLWNRTRAQHLRAQVQRHTVQVVSKMALKKTLDETEDWLQLFFKPVEQNLLLARSWGNSGLLDTDPSESLDQLMIPLVQHYPQISSMMVADERGREQMLLRLENDALDGSPRATWRRRLMRRDAWGDRAVWTEWNDRPSEGKQTEGELPTYDARDRPWYLGAMERQVAKETSSRFPAAAAERVLVSWTKPYPFFTTKEPGISASIGFRPPDGPEHVVAFDVSLEDITKFTSSKNPTTHGSVLVLTSEKEVVGLPHARELQGAERRQAAFLKPPSELGIPVVTDATDLFSSSDLSLSENGDSQIHQFTSEGKRWWAGMRPYRLSVDRTLWILVIVPESDLRSEL